MIKKIIKTIPFLFLFLSCSQNVSNNAVTGSKFLLGTTCVINLNEYEKNVDPQDLLQHSFQLISDLENQLSVNIPESDLSLLNQSGEEGYLPGKGVSAVLQEALAIAELSGGRFDPSIGNLVALWGIGTDHAAVPADTAIEAAVRSIDYSKIRIESDGRVKLLVPGMKLDLGGIAKGYAADIVRNYLLKSGVVSGIINLGGNVLLVGNKSNGEKWRIGVQDPRELRGDYMGIITNSSCAVVTSGVYERFFMQDGVRYHHILDTETGFPVNNGVISTTVVYRDSLEADGLSTALFAMGMPGGLEKAEALPGVDIIMVTSDNEVYVTSGLKDSFKLTSDKYRIVR